MKCSRCGAEDSMFWYPYAFGVAPIPSVVDRCTDRAQYFNLCDKCQRGFVDFMHNTKLVIYPEHDIDTKKLEEMIKGQPVIIPGPEDYQ